MEKWRNARNVESPWIVYYSFKFKMMPNLLQYRVNLINGDKLKRCHLMLIDACRLARRWNTFDSRDHAINTKWITLKKRKKRHAILNISVNNWANNNTLGTRIIRRGRLFIIWVFLHPDDPYSGLPDYLILSFWAPE